MNHDNFEDYCDNSMTATPRAPGSLMKLIAKGIQVAFCLVVGVPVLLAFVAGFVGGYSGNQSVGEQELDGGVAAMQAGRMATALESFQQVATMERASGLIKSVANFRIAEWHSKQSHHEAAIEAANTALAMADLPEYYRFRALVYRGEAHANLMKFDESLADVEAVLGAQQADDISKAIALRCRALVLSSRGDVQKALADETEALRLARSDKELQSNIRYNRAVSYRELGDTERELAEYGIVIDEGTASPEFLARSRMNRGVMHYRNGQTAEGLLDMEAAEQLGDVSIRSTVLENLIVFYSEAGNIEKELASTEKLMNLPNATESLRARAFYLRGVALLKAEKSDEAREALVKARALAVVNDLTDVIEAIDSITDNQLQAAIEN